MKKIKLNWPSPAKINLFLYVNQKRKDGYHNIQTLLQFLNYGDIIKIKKTKNNKIKIVNNFSNISEKNNLIFKSAKLLKQYSQKIKPNNNFGAKIYIKKNLPIGSGLGGGSSNAATTLIALNYLWKINLSDQKLTKISYKLGADIPFFINGHSSFAEGIGNQLLYINLKEKWNLILYPKISISTKKIFQKINLKKKIKKKNLENLLKKPYKNNFELIVRKMFPKIEKLFLWKPKNKKLHLTGTGSCVFIQFKNKKKAIKISKKIPKWTKSFIAKSINYSPLHKFRDLILKKNQ